MNGIELSARYGFPPNSLGYCGKDSFTATLRDHLKWKKDIAALEKELRKFKAQFAYLSLIAAENNKKPFDKDVVEAFWIGNDLLGNISHEALELFILKDLFDSKQSSRASKLVRSLPKGMVPHHSFNSLYINFVTDSVERSVENLDSCCITWGKVLSVSGDSVAMMRNAISKDRDGKFIIIPKKSSIALQKKGICFMNRVSRGDVLSVHWGMAIEKLSQKRARALERYTKMNIRACNSDFILS
jgi:hydrogenase maturation factor